MVREMTRQELDALPVGAVVVPTNEDWQIGAAGAGWRKADPPGPNGPWWRVDESEGASNTSTAVLAMIGVTLKEMQK